MTHTDIQRQKALKDKSQSGYLQPADGLEDKEGREHHERVQAGAGHDVCGVGHGHAPGCVCVGVCKTG